MACKVRTYLRYVLFALALSCFGACNETLPVRDDVTNLVTTSIRSSYETTSHSSATGQIRLFITMVNGTDETLEDVAQISGAMEITWLVPKDIQPMVDISRSIKLSSNNIFYARRFNRLSNRLTVDPNDSVVLSVVWNLKSNDSTYLLKYFPVVEDQKCNVSTSGSIGPRRITLPQHFSVKASMRLFDKLSVFYAQEISIKHCIMVGHNGEANFYPRPPCTDFTQFDPCYEIGQ